MLIAQCSLKQLFICLLQQLIEIWHVRWTEATALSASEKCVYSLAVGRRITVVVTYYVMTRYSKNTVPPIANTAKTEPSALKLSPSHTTAIR